MALPHSALFLKQTKVLCVDKKTGMPALYPGPQLSQERRDHQTGAGRGPGPCLTPRRAIWPSGFPLLVAAQPLTVVGRARACPCLDDHGRYLALAATHSIRWMAEVSFSC